MKARSYFIIVNLFFYSFFAVTYGQECNDEPPNFIFPQYSGNLTLYIDSITSLPGDVVFLGGYYRDVANIHHSVLLVSRDAGLTWKDAELAFVGSDIGYFQTYGIVNIWALVTFRQEGSSSPQFLLSSTDAGKSWCTHPIDNIRISEPRVWVSEFKFFDTLNGLISIEGSLGGISTFYTRDGGNSWYHLWVIHRNEVVESPNSYKRLVEQPSNLAPLWMKTIDNYYKYRVARMIRFREEKENYVVEISNASENREWKQVSRIRRHYRVTTQGPWYFQQNNLFSKKAK